MVRRIVAVAAVWTAVLAGGMAQAAEACMRQYHSVYVELDMSRYPQTTGHWIDAIDAGHAALLHISPADNRGAGSSMASQLEAWCEEQPFRIRFVP